MLGLPGFPLSRFMVYYFCYTKGRDKSAQGEGTAWITAGTESG